MGWPNVVDNSPRLLVRTVQRSADFGAHTPYETRYTYYDGRRYLSTDWERRGKSLRRLEMLDDAVSVADEYGT